MKRPRFLDDLPHHRVPQMLYYDAPGRFDLYALLYTTRSRITIQNLASSGHTTKCLKARIRRCIDRWKENSVDNRLSHLPPRTSSDESSNQRVDTIVS